MFWNNGNLKLRRKRCGKQEIYVMLWKGNELRIFLLGDAEVRTTLLTFITKREVTKHRMWLELAQGILRRRVMALAASNLQFFTDL